MNYEILKVSEADGVVTVVNSRPQALNALNSRFFAEMGALLKDLAGRGDVKVVVLTGEGKAFAAGADIAEMKDMDSAQGKAFSQLGQGVFQAMEDLPQPVLAAVNGFALGGGCELAMACDVRVASSAAKFGQPEVNLGLTPGYAGTQRLPRLIGPGAALSLLLTGDMIAADEALRLGLVQKVTAPEALMTEVQAMAKKIASKGPKAVRLVKRLVRQGMRADFKTGCGLESELFGSLFGDEGAEGMKAFLEKRPAKW
ncbi:MAG: enoyl-CoA hydratase/isomerase family protein [Elusimicrobia bacterium]|nr:enoyl-CoA hydratase/isomerase family protein [Elusimicrobiota bacterium]